MTGRDDAASDGTDAELYADDFDVFADPDAAFLDDPSFRDGLEHPLYGAETDTTLAWFDGVTDDVNENHAQHVEWLLD